MSSHKILKNTFALYIRQAILILINLYTLRLILNGLGAADFGIYTVISGVVALASFLPNALSSTTQRYFSFALGRNDQSGLIRIFSANIMIYIGIGALALLALESIGLWLVQEYLNMPKHSYETAKSLYQISIFTFIFTLIASPFLAIIIAHEEMEIYAYVSLYEAIAKLIAANLITHLSSEKLITYATFILIISASTSLIYMIICRRRYPTCKFEHSTVDLSTFKELSSFTTWTIFGQLTTIARNQAITIILNQAFSPTIAAARAISTTIATQVMVFSSNFNTSLYPPIIKHYSANEKAQMFNILMLGSKLSFFLLWIFLLPLYIEMDTILRIWLITPPIETIYFSQLALIETAIMAISLPLATAARASGKMRLYELSLGSIQLMILITSWILLSKGYPAESVFFVAITANIIMFFVRLIIVSPLIGLSVSTFLKAVGLPVIAVVLISAAPSIFIKSKLPAVPQSSILTIFFSMALSVLIIFYVGFDANTRQKLSALIKAKLTRVF